MTGNSNPGYSNNVHKFHFWEPDHGIDDELKRTDDMADQFQTDIATLHDIIADRDGQVARLRVANNILTKEKNTYLRIFESIASPVAVLDEHNRIHAVNPAWAVLFGNPLEPGSDGKSPAVDRPMAWLLTTIDRFMANGDAEQTMEESVWTAKGEQCLSIKIKRLPNEHGTNIGCLVIADVPKYPQAPKTGLSKDTVVPMEIVNALEAATRNSERLQGALELAGAVCHDMNQPLMAITGYAELIMMDCSKESPHFEKLKKIVDHVAKMGDITKKLMHVTRYETKVYLDKKIIDIDKASGGS